MGEVDIVFFSYVRELKTLVVIKTRHAVAAPTAVGVDEADGFFGKFAVFYEAAHPRGGVITEWLDAWHEENFFPKAHVPPLAEAGDFFELGLHAGEILVEVFADHFHHFPDGLSGMVLGASGKATEKGDVDRGVELGEGLALDAEPLAGIDRATGVEPLGDFQPVAEFLRVLVEAEVLQHEADRAERLGVTRELVVIEVHQVLIPIAADIDNADGGVSKVRIGRLPPEDGDRILGDEEGACEEVILMRAAGVHYYFTNHARGLPQW